MSMKMNKCFLIWCDPSYTRRVIVCLFFFFFFYLGKQTQFYLFLSLVLSPYRELLWSPVPTDFCRIVYCTCSAWLIGSYSKVKAHTVSNLFHDHSCWIHTSLWFSVFVEPMLHIASQRRQQKKSLSQKMNRFRRSCQVSHDSFRVSLFDKIP